MPPALSDEEAYASSEDSDFAPDANNQQAGLDLGSDSESESEDETRAATSGGIKRKRPSSAREKVDEAEDAGFENSGDEAVIQKGQKKKTKRRRDDGGEEGHLIKTRSQRAAEKEVQKVVTARGPVTIDVDKVWADMNAGLPADDAPTGPENGEDDGGPPADEENGAIVHLSGGRGSLAGAPPAENTGKTMARATGGDDSEMILIKRKYNFAGKIHTEEKLVPRSSAEAQLYLSSIAGDPNAAEAAAAAAADMDGPPRQIRRAFRSRFEPQWQQAAALQRVDLNLTMTLTLSRREDQDRAAKKLSTVEKSRMDWAGYVDQEGLKDELELAGRSKGSYAAREDFLSRSDSRREEEAWKARVAGRK